MKLYQRYFCYGSVFTSLAWGLLIYLYVHVQDKAAVSPNWPTLDNSKKLVKFKPRHGAIQTHHNDNFDFIYGHETLEGEDDVINFKRQNVRLQPQPNIRNDQPQSNIGNIQPQSHMGNAAESKRELSELGIIKTAEDQKIRDQGKGIPECAVRILPQFSSVG